MLSFEETVLKLKNILPNNILKYNLLTHDIELTSKLPFSRVDVKDHTINDREILEIRYYFECTTKAKTSTKMITDAIIIVAVENPYHPIRDWLETLKWDGVKRLNKWLIDYCGAEDEKYVREVGRKVLVASIARVYQPGIKFDYMLILEGETGIGKTQLVKALGEDWSIDIELRDCDKDTIDKMRGAWIIEIPELAGMKRTEIETLKAFLSRPMDRERFAYARRSENFPRQSIFIGTHNPSGNNTYFWDDTGHRRFWPITCQKADYEGVRRVRDQLFAEAYIEWFAKKEKLYITDSEIIKKVEEEQRNRLASDPWQDTISKYLIGKDEQAITGKEILEHLKIFPEKQTVSHLMRVGIVMKKLGWEKRRPLIGDNRQWAYKNKNEIGRA